MSKLLYWSLIVGYTWVTLFLTTQQTGIYRQILSLSVIYVVLLLGMVAQSILFFVDYGKRLRLKLAIQFLLFINNAVILDSVEQGLSKGVVVSAILIGIGFIIGQEWLSQIRDDKDRQDSYYWNACFFCSCQFKRELHEIRSSQNRPHLPFSAYCSDGGRVIFLKR